jgi:hypothetical protein
MIASGPVVVLNKGVEDTADAERGLDNFVGSVLVSVLDTRNPLNGEQILADPNLALDKAVQICCFIYHSCIPD